MKDVVGKPGGKWSFTELNLIGGGFEEADTGRETKRIKQISSYNTNP